MEETVYNVRDREKGRFIVGLEHPARILGISSRGTQHSTLYLTP